MKKVYIGNTDNQGTKAKLVKSKLLEKLDGKVEIITLPSEAEWYFSYIDDEKMASMKKYKDKKAFCYMQDENGEIQILSPEEQFSKNVGYYVKQETTERVKIDPICSQDTVNKLSLDIIEYLVGRAEKVTILDPFPFASVYPLIGIYVEANKRYKDNKKIESLKTKYNLNDDELEIIRQNVLNVTKNKECGLGFLLRKPKSYYTQMVIKNVSGLIIPNNSDNIAANLVDARITSIYYSASKDAEKKKNMANRYAESVNSAIKTAERTLIGSNKGFEIFAKDDQKQNGVYGLYIVDNTLKDGEIIIPNPHMMKLNTLKRKIKHNGEEHEVVFLYNSKVILINGPHANRLRTVYKNGNYSYWKVYTNVPTDFNVREYPSIGEYVVTTRHPITTLVLKLKVVGFSDDCSIRVNAKTALALYGDADGDSFVISWSRWTDSLKLHGVVELNKFCEAAKIATDQKQDEFNNEFDFNDFFELKPDNEETCLEKSSASGLEQAKAKQVTKTETGTWGAAERDLVQTLIINKININMEMLYKKSLLSQMLVQAKNILAKLQEEGDLDKETEETIILLNLIMGNAKKTAYPVSNLLGVEYKEALGIINTLSGKQVAERAEEIKCGYTEDDFFAENQDIAFQR